MSICPLCGAGGLKRLVWLKYYIIPKWQITFNLGPNAAKNTHYIEKKASNKSRLELNLIQRSPQSHVSIFHQSGARGLERLIWLKYYTVLKLQITFNLGLTAAKNTHYMEKSFK